MNRSLRILLLITLVPFLSRAVPAAAPTPDSEKVTSHMVVVHGPVNGVRIETNGVTLAVYGDPRPGAPRVDRVLLTHSRRDVVWAARKLIEQGAMVVAPEWEAPHLLRPQEFWQRFEQGRFHNYSQVSTKVPAEALAHVETVRPGETLTWQGLSIRVLPTPGYTAGAVSYLVKLDDQTVAFTGDLVYGDGKILDLFSFQDAIPEARIGGYHGYAARLADLVTSLRRLRDERPDLIIPARGPVIRNPADALDNLVERVQALYANYLSVDALRWYFGDQHIRAKARRVLGPEARVNWMSMAETNPLPAWVTAIDNSRLIQSADGSGFLIDCGSARILERLQELRRDGRLTSLDQIFISHYHDDHTDQVPAAAAAFQSTVLACHELCDILEHPGAFALPCLTRHPILVSGRLTSGARWRWKEFLMTAYYFPGQTLYHQALLVQKDGAESILFVGDSFTPTGVDDYCLQNRNLLHPDMGFFRCLSLLNTLPAGCWLVNQHVLPMFRFSESQKEQMLAALEMRVDLLRSLFPWDNPNYGLDESWARLQPYGIETAGTNPFTCRAVLFNHSDGESTFEIQPHLPPNWTLRELAPRRVRVPPRQEGVFEFTVVPAAETRPGLYVITTDVAGPHGEFREWMEALVRVNP